MVTMVTMGQAVVGQLPARNGLVLQELLAFLCEVAEHEEANKMGVNNLAIVFGPNILRTEDEAAGFLCKASPVLAPSSHPNDEMQKSITILAVPPPKCQLISLSHPPM